MSSSLSPASGTQVQRSYIEQTITSGWQKVASPLPIDKHILVKIGIVVLKALGALVMAFATLIGFLPCLALRLLPKSQGQVAVSSQQKAGDQAGKGVEKETPPASSAIPVVAQAAERQSTSPAPAPVSRVRNPLPPLSLEQLNHSLSNERLSRAANCLRTLPKTTGPILFAMSQTLIYPGIKEDHPLFRIIEKTTFGAQQYKYCIGITNEQLTTLVNWINEQEAAKSQAGV